MPRLIDLAEPTPIARTDADFDPIRADPRFVALVGDADAE